MSSSRETSPQPPAPGDDAPPEGSSAGSSNGVPPDLRTAGVFTADLLAVVVFVLLGRTSHGESEALHGVLITLWPFLAGLLTGWLVLLAGRIGAADGYRAGGFLVVATVAVGMVLRHVVSHDGTPVSFVIAATTFLTIFYLGWRAVARFVARRRLTR